ncbi:carbonic anhydrase [Bacillaceae bacterium Marseille-Q3522]|nr:carbonic anhydrase [Bacillaceae bacterium Marseille-Q3522]
MKLLEQILQYNQQFVAGRSYEPFATSKFPDKKMVVLSCMDTRLLELLPNAINVKNGDIKMIKNAGALVSHPFGSIMRSILVAVYQLQAEEVFVIGHHDCGMSGMVPEKMLQAMLERGVKEETLQTLQYSGVDLMTWLKGFDNVKESVTQSVTIIKNHPLMPQDVPVHGLAIDPATGKLDLLIDGYSK